MKFLIIIFLSIIYTQDRSLIFTTGAPLGNCASSTTPCNTDTDCAFGNTCVPPEYHTINSTYSLSNRIYASGNMALEAMKFYAEPTDESSFAKIILQEDNDGIPGEEIQAFEHSAVLSGQIRTSLVWRSERFAVKPIWNQNPAGMQHTTIVAHL